MIDYNDFKVGKQVSHNKYGLGIVIEDKEGLCRENEVFVKFDENLPFLQSTDDRRCFSDTVYHEIVSIDDLVTELHTDDKQFSEKFNNINLKMIEQNRSIKVGDIIKGSNPFSEFSEVIRIDSTFIYTTSGCYIIGDQFLKIK